MQDNVAQATVLDVRPDSRGFLQDTLWGLDQPHKQLPSKYFYDQRGSQLFEQICQLDEYYPTRTELAIMRRYGLEMARQIGPSAMLVEYGSGSSLKTRILLDQLDDLVAYVPVDISRGHLQQTANQLARAYPDVEILPVCADFTHDFKLPVPQRRASHVAVYFPGSTIGNFRPDGAVEILTRIARLCGAGGGLLIGIDLQKDVGTLEAAYNDSQGVTAEFNLNVLRRINLELGGDFDLHQFEHRAIYNDDRDRIEMHLVSRCDQEVTVAGQSFDFAEGETVCTEYSHKYSIDGFAAQAAQAGLTLKRSWTDDRHRFAVLHLTLPD